MRMGATKGSPELNGSILALFQNMQVNAEIEAGQRTIAHLRSAPTLRLYFEKMRGFLQRARDNKATDPDGNPLPFPLGKYELETLLFIASDRGLEEDVELLIECKVDANAVNLHGQSPLHFAAEAIMDHTNDEGYVPGAFGGFVGLMNHYLACVCLIDEGGANVNAVDQFGWTPVMAACQQGHEKIVRLLLERGADAQGAEYIFGSSCLHRAVIENHMAVVALLVETAASPWQKVWSLEHETHYWSNYETGEATWEDPKVLVTQEALDADEIAEAKYEAEAAAAEAEAVAAEAEAGARPRGALAGSGGGGSTSPRTPGPPASGDQAEATGGGGGAVARAPPPVLGRARRAELRNRKRALVDAVDRDGWNACHLAALNGHEDMLVMLAVECGANLAARNYEGDTPLHVAARNEDAGLGTLRVIVDTLGDLGAFAEEEEDKAAVAWNIDDWNEKGESALHQAAAAGACICARFLLDRGATVNAVNNAGHTPLDVALASTNIGLGLHDHDAGGNVGAPGAAAADIARVLKGGQPRRKTPKYRTVTLALLRDRGGLTARQLEEQQHEAKDE